MFGELKYQILVATESAVHIICTLETGGGKDQAGVGLCLTRGGVPSTLLYPVSLLIGCYD